MNIKQASKTLGLSQKSLRRHIKKGSIQARIIEGRNGKEYEIDPESLESFKTKKAEKTLLPTIEDKKQSGTALTTLDNRGTPTLDKEKKSIPLETLPTLGILDLGQGRVGHHKDLRMGKPSRYIDNIPDILTSEEVSQFLGVGVSTVQDYLREGKLKGVKLGKGWKISKDNLKIFVKKLFG